MFENFDFDHFSSFTVDGKERPIGELKKYIEETKKNIIITEKLNIGDRVKLKGRDFIVVINNTDCEVEGIGKVDYTGKREGQLDNRLYFFNQNQITEIISKKNEKNNMEER